MQETVFGLKPPGPPLLFRSEHREQRMPLAGVVRKVNVRTGSVDAGGGGGGVAIAPDYVCGFTYDHMLGMLSAA